MTTFSEKFVKVIFVVYICLLMIMVIICIGSGRAEVGVTWEEAASVWPTMCSDSGHSVCQWIRFLDWV